MAKDNLPIYKITIDPEYAENGEELGIEAIAFTIFASGGFCWNQVSVIPIAFNPGICHGASVWVNQGFSRWQSGWMPMRLR